MDFICVYVCNYIVGRDCFKCIIPTVASILRHAKRDIDRTFDAPRRENASISADRNVEDERVTYVSLVDRQLFLCTSVNLFCNMAGRIVRPVSYTHLTLPTILLV